MSRALPAAPQPRPFWLCADDYGIAPGVNTAIRDLIMRGRLNATSVMTAAPAFDRSEAAALDILNSGERRVAIGLHVTLPAPFKPLSTNYGPLRDGEFLPLQAMMLSAFLGRLKRDRLAMEIATQLKAFVVAFGRVPDFVDGHQHVHLLPQVREAFLTVVRIEVDIAKGVMMPISQTVQDFIICSTHGLGRGIVVKACAHEDAEPVHTHAIREGHQLAHALVRRAGEAGDMAVSVPDFHQRSPGRSGRLWGTSAAKSPRLVQ